MSMQGIVRMVACRVRDRLVGLHTSTQPVGRPTTNSSIIRMDGETSNDAITGDGEIEPRREKTGLRGFRPGPTQTGLYRLRKELEA